MISKAAWSSRDIWAGPLAIIAGSGVLWMFGAPVEAALAYQRDLIRQGQWWRLCTGNWVHLGGWHYGLNALSLLLWIGVCPQRLRLADWGWRLLLIGSGVGLGLYWTQPSLQQYVGLSGFVYGLFALDLGRDAVLRQDRFAALALAFLLARVAYEVVNGTPAYERTLIGGAVVASAHVCGMVAASIYGVLGHGLARWRHQNEPTTGDYG